jgi:2-oxoglutarate dehydrogenase E2 component (dihydrolipoamide succinyltransferase)
MSFFVKATVDALKQYPVLNAEVRATNIVYRNFYDIGVAVGGGRGLVVPVLRNAERMSFAEVETAIGDFGKRAKENSSRSRSFRAGPYDKQRRRLRFSSVYTHCEPASKRCAGMHAIQERPVRDGNVAVRPMMYVALTHDHRIVDGREAVSFQKRLKEAVETPARMLLEI